MQNTEALVRDFLADPWGSDGGALHAVVRAYPWLTAARVVAACAGGTDDPMLRLHFHAWPRPQVPPREDVETEEKNDAGDLIERFLSAGEHRIVPDEGVTDDDAAARSAGFDPAGGPVTESLAEIFLAQGLKEQAAEIYRKLSLVYPEKSVYFAEIIENIKP